MYPPAAAVAAIPTASAPDLAMKTKHLALKMTHLEFKFTHTVICPIDMIHQLCVGLFLLFELFIVTVELYSKASVLLSEVRDNLLFLLLRQRNSKRRISIRSIRRSRRSSMRSNRGSMRTSSSSMRSSSSSTRSSSNMRRGGRRLLLLLHRCSRRRCVSFSRGLRWKRMLRCLKLSQRRRSSMRTRSSSMRTRSSSMKSSSMKSSSRRGGHLLLLPLT
jgi:hypothetical protein